MEDPIVGIDLGTSNTVVAHAEGQGPAAVLADANGFKIHPSVVSFHPSGGVVVGAAAKQRKVIDPRNTIYSVKRLIGRAFGSKEVQTAKQRAPYQIKEGANQLPLIVTRGGEFAVPEISAIVLDHVKNVASQALQTDVSRAVVTVPASFNDAQRSATATAGSIAGLTVVRVLNEPTAAALAYGHTRNLNETIAVYDFGGGTFDITILKLADQVYEVLGTSGDSFLGGDDLDERIVDRMVDKFLAENRVDLRTNEVSMMRLRAVAEQTKIELSRRSRAVVRVDEIAYGAKGKPLDLQIEIRREEFVSQVSDIIDKTFPVCAEALKLAGVGVGAIDDVILVGGTTKIPYVRDQVTKFFGRAPRTDVSPEDAVALGAALQGAALERILKKKTSISVVDAIPKPIGVSFDDEDEGTYDGGETQTFAGAPPGEHEDTYTSPELGPPGASQLRETERPVERGKHHDVFQNRPPQPPQAPPNMPVIGRLTKQVSPPPGAKPVVQTPSQGVRTTAPRVPAQRPPAVPSAPPQAKTMMLEPSPATHQPTVIVDQESLSPAATAPGMGKAGGPARGDSRADDFLDLTDDDVGFPNLTTEKGFLDLDDSPSAASTAKGFPAPATTAKGFPTPPTPAKTQTMPSMTPPPVRTTAPQAQQARPPAPPQPPQAPARPPAPQQPAPHARPPIPQQQPAPHARPPIPQQQPQVRAPAPQQPAPAAARAVPVAPPMAPTMAIQPPAYAPLEDLSARESGYAPLEDLATPAYVPLELEASPARPEPTYPQLELDAPPSRPAPSPYTPPAPAPPMRAAPNASPVVLDVTPRGLGIGTVAGFCEELIRRNSRVPTEMRKMFVTSRDDQDAVRIIVVQGESRRMQQNTVIADLRLDNLPRRPRGETSIEVTFALDANGILNVHARDAKTGREQRATLDIIGSIAQEDVSASRERLQALRR